MMMKTYDAEFKTKLALEALKGGKTAAQLCREHNIAQDLLSRWRTELIERAPELFKTPLRLLRVGHFHFCWPEIAATCAGCRSRQW